MKSLSKSRYTLFRQYPRALWMTLYKPVDGLDFITEKVLSEHLLNDAEEHALAEAI